MPRKPTTQAEVLQRYPSLTAHIICASLGYATPGTAASIILDHIRGEQNWCEWIHHCFRGEPAGAIRWAWEGRHCHNGFMADYRKARILVEDARLNGREPILMSW